MRRLAKLGSLLVLLVFGCSSGDKTRPDLIPPEFRVREISGQFRPHANETVPITLQVDIFNHSAEDLVLKRLQIQSMGGGAYRFGPASKIFNFKIPSQSVQTFEIPVDASLESIAIDPSTPVTIRGTAIFESPFGKFRRVFVSPLEDRGASGIR